MNPKAGDLVILKSRELELIKKLKILNGESTQLVGVGLVIDVRYPMKDDTTWSDHQVLWTDSGEMSIEWCEDLKVLIDAE